MERMTEPMNGTGGISSRHVNRSETPGLLRKLGLFDTMSLVVGTIIGSGIFLVPAEVAREVHTTAGIFAVWIFGAVFTMLGALTLAELGAAIPQAGGIYTFIARGFGRLPAFLCGWVLFTVATSGSIATLAVAFPIYLQALVPMTASVAKLASLGAVSFFTAVNLLGVAAGARIQNLLTASKIAGILAMIGIVLRAPARAAVLPSAGPSSGPGIAAFGIALVAVLWAYEGWHDVGFAAGEMRNPRRDFPIAAVGGTAIVVALYLAANLAYLHVLSPGEIAAAPRVASAAMRLAGGAWADRLLSIAIVCSILGALNALVLAGPRAYYQMAVDGLFFRRFASVHPRWRTPWAAIVLQAVWSGVLILGIGEFGRLFTYVIFGGWIFYAMAVAAVIPLRKKEPDLPRAFLVPGYPVTPLLFVAAAAAIVANTLVERPREALLGLAFIAAGIPLYFVTAHRRRGGG